MPALSKISFTRCRHCRARIEQVLSEDKRIEALAEDFSDKHHALFLGRGDQYPIALEGALKLERDLLHSRRSLRGGRAEARPVGAD
ncbi:Glucosamine--fructose-6-phosphate aminotransferase [isomerizing] [Kluyvera cryocrescens]|uniref:Glucosamine--fructose-6-phosphate aminotransferase [isomerizing] n=1 Tax=Kluyvera cryocrescens TaxID=580 RepID=A0A485B3M5_KLUCR|nr:Glucosamine--fructose-6-phosphate aminotransferase [isomerizing] [Kluyvera cryocrescens]